MEPSETIKNRRAPGIHQPPPSPPLRPPRGLWGCGEARMGPPLRTCVPTPDTSSARCLRVPARRRLASPLPARACTPPRRAAGREGCRRRMQAKDAGTARRGQAPAPAPARLGAGLPPPCPLRGDAALPPALPIGRHWRTPVLPDRWDPLRRKDVPVTLPAETRGDERNPDRQKPTRHSLGALRPTQLSPRVIHPPPPPDQTGITAQTGCGQSSLPTATGSRGAPWGAGRAPGGQRTVRGAGEHPCARAGLRLETRHNSSHGFGGTPNPARREVPSGANAGPPTAPPAFPLPRARACAQAQRQETPASVKKAPEGNGESEKKPAGGEQEGPRPPPPQYGVRRDTPPRRGARLRCRHRRCLIGDSPLGETEARRQAWRGGGEQLGTPRCVSPPLILPGRETLPPNTHAVAGMTPAPRPPPAPPCSCRNPGAGAAGRRPAPPSCLRLPPLPAPRAPRGEGGEHSRLGSIPSVSPSPQPWDATG